MTHSCPTLRASDLETPSRSEARSWLIGWPRRLCDWQGSYCSTSPSRCSGLMRRPMSNAFPIRRAASICGRKRAICAGLLKITWSDAFIRSEEHTSELQSLMRISYAVFCLKKKKKQKEKTQHTTSTITDNSYKNHLMILYE